MRIVLDLQGCQLWQARDWNRAIYALSLSKAIVLHSAEKHEIWLALNGGIANTVEPIRAAFDPLIPQERIVVWQPGPVDVDDVSDSLARRVAERVWEAFLTSLKPDVVCTTGSISLSAISHVGEFDDRIPTAVIIDDAIATFTAEVRSKDRAVRSAASRKLTHLKRASLCVVSSEEARETAIRLLGSPEESVVRISADAAGAQRAIAIFEKLRTERFPKVAHRKPRLAFVSPLPPEQTGIATYSSELLPALSHHYEIEVVVDQEEVSDPWIRSNLPIRHWRWFDEHAEEYERILYHFGNSPFHYYMYELLERHAGAVVLHDFYLGHGLEFKEYKERLDQGSSNRRAEAFYASHGYKPFREWLGQPQSINWNYPGCWQVLAHAEGIIVHSQYSRQLGMQWFPNASLLKWACIPHLRTPVLSPDYRKARLSLGFEPDDFVVCSFGFMGEAKLNVDLLEAWLASPLARDPRCKLVFVGQLPTGKFGSGIRKRIDSSPAPERIRITGYASTEHFQAYLATADVGVQLRQNSRGETSGTVLDCMNYGMPVVVNAHGTFAEFPDEHVIKLPETFRTEELADALVSLWQDPQKRRAIGKRAQYYVHEVLAPEKIAAQYRDAIEAFSAESWRSTQGRLVKSLANIRSQFNNGDYSWLELAEAVACNQRGTPHPEAQLLIDVTVVAVRDLRTGIQRVVRSILSEFLLDPPAGYRPEPVYRDKHGVYRYARQFTQRFLGCEGPKLEDEPIDARFGDIFFGLDLHSHSVWLHRREFERMRDRGVRIVFLLHDLLPVLRPSFFPPKEFRSFYGWLETISHVSHGIVCVSRAVADELYTWLEQTKIRRHTPLNIGYNHHGADIVSSAPTQGVHDGFEEKLALIANNRTFLVVGTLEPRKGYMQTLAAFERLWDTGKNVILVIVGKKGWMMDSLVDYIRRHDEFGKRLIWFEGATDEMLLTLYEKSSALIMPSEGEGFGLPLIEAAMHKLPIIARDLPVSREVSGSHAFYFNGLTPENMARAIEEWLARFEKGGVPLPDEHPWQTWKESAENLKSILIDDKWYKQKRWASPLVDDTVVPPKSPQFSS
ncbi:MAG TPA: glycosyltransferase [Chthoniobacterales bacterium]